MPISKGYGLGSPLLDIFPVPIQAQRPPATSDVGPPIGQLWVDSAADSAWILVDVSAGAATWIAIGGGSSAVSNLAGDAGLATPAAGIITIAGGTNMNTSAAGSTVTVNLDQTVAITGNFSTSNATVAGSQSVSVTNSDNTNPLSNAVVNLTTGGASGGDPAVQFNVTGVAAASWRFGVDNSASDAFVLANSTALGTTNVVSFATGTGIATFGLGNIIESRSEVGNDVVFLLSNNDNTNGASRANLTLNVGGAAGGDAVIQFAVAGVATQWTVGMDNSDGDNFVFSPGATLGPSVVLSLNQSSYLATFGGDTLVTRANPGVAVSSEIFNSDNSNVLSHSVLLLKSGGAAGGDPFIIFEIDSVVDWAIGTDNSSGDAFIIGQAAALGANDVFSIALNGDTTILQGNLIIGGVARQLQMNGGAVTDFIGQATLAAGTVTVANTNIAANDRIFVSYVGTGLANTGALSTTIVAATSFTIESTNGADTNTVSYFIVRQN